MWKRKCLLDTRSHLLRFGIWIPNTYPKHRTSGGMAACLGQGASFLDPKNDTLTPWRIFFDPGRAPKFHGYQGDLTIPWGALVAILTPKNMGSSEAWWLFSLWRNPIPMIKKAWDWYSAYICLILMINVAKHTIHECCSENILIHLLYKQKYSVI